MMPWKRLAAVFNALLALWSITTLAYSTGAGSAFPLAVNLPEQKRIPTSRHSKTFTTDICKKLKAPISTRVSVDLGVGKHPPLLPLRTRSDRTKSLLLKPSLVSSRPHHAHAPYVMSDVVQYLVDHETVHQYPSPYETKGDRSATMSDNESSNNNIKNNKRQHKRIDHHHVPIVPERRTGNDDLWIQNQHSCVQHNANSSKQGTTARDPLVAVAQKPKRQWELNTPWVEMLIHEQQRKLSL